MTVALRYFNLVADLLGRREEVRIVVAGTTVRGLLSALALESASFGRLFPVAGAAPGGALRVFCNGQAVLELDRPLADGDELRLFSAISGG